MIDATLPSWLQPTQDELIVQVKIYAQPGSKVSGVAGEFDGSLKVKISSPPVDGAANEALTLFLAQKLGIKIRNVTLIHGQMSRNKIFQVVGLKSSEIMEKLLL